MIRNFVYIFGYIIFLAGLIFGYVKYIEFKSVFFPYKAIEATPESLNMPFEDIYIETQDHIKINGWFIPEQDAEYVILFCHGNAGNISHRLEKIILLRQLGVNIFIIDYRGYGRSRGRPSEKGLYLDAQAAYEYLMNVKKFKAENIILYGESLGGAVIINLAKELETGGLITEGLFSSAKDMARRFYFFLPPVLFSDKFNSIAKISKVDAPKLFIHSRDDEIIPFDLAEKLYHHAKEPKKLIELTGSHNTAFLDSQETYVSSMKSFLEQIKNKNIE